MLRYFITGLSVVFFAASTHAARHEFIRLGFPDGAVDNRVDNISGDGRVVVGRATFDGRREAYRWTVDEGFQLLGDIVGGAVDSFATDVSYDGSVVVGRGTSGPLFGDPNSGIEGFWWSEATGILPMGDIPTGTYNSSALAVSGNGQVAVGRSATGAGYRAFTWSPGHTIVNMGNVSGAVMEQSEAFDISHDGQVIVGRVHAQNVATGRAFRWTPDLGMHLLLDPSEGNFFHEAYGVSPDGNVVVGSSSIPSEGQKLFRWTEANGFEALASVNGGQASAIPEESTYDGSVIVGAIYGDGDPWAFAWDETNGIRNLLDTFANDFGLGTEVEGWTLREASSISYDGSVIAGWGVNPDGVFEGWIVRIVPEPASTTIVITIAGCFFMLRVRKQ